MLQFYFDFIDRFVERGDLEYCEMDTDSAYMTISGPSFESVIKSDMIQHYQYSLKGHCMPGLNIEGDCERHWFPRTWCKAHAKYDRRTYIVSTRERVNQSNTKITADRLRNKAIKNKFLNRKRVKDRIVNKSKFSYKFISEKRVQTPLTTFRTTLKLRTHHQV